MLSKCLSLELLKGVVENAGPAFRSSDKFIQAIRQYLCVSLLRNCTSNISEVVDLSLQVFVQLITHFKVCACLSPCLLASLPPCRALLRTHSDSISHSLCSCRT